MISIQDIQTLFQWPFLALQQDDSFNKLLSIFPFFSMLYMISSLKSQSSPTTQNLPYHSFLCNEPLYIQYLVLRASDDMTDHPGHVSDHAMTPIASLSDFLPEENKAISRELEFTHTSKTSTENEEESNNSLVAEEPVFNEVSEQMRPTLPEEDAAIQPKEFDDKKDSIEEFNENSEKGNLSDEIEGNSVVQEEPEIVEDFLPKELISEPAPSARIIIQKIPEKSRVINFQRYKPIHVDLLSTVHSKYTREDIPIELSPFSKWLRSTIDVINENSPAAQYSPDYSNEDEIVQKSSNDKPKSPKKMEIERVISDSVRDHAYLVTEQYADLLHSQGYLERAINIYGKLMEKYPEKSSIFATKIQEINKEIV